MAVSLSALIRRGFEDACRDRDATLAIQGAWSAEPQLRGLLPDPSLALVPDLALLDERAQHLNDEEWVSLGVSVQYREQLAPQLLTARRRGEPLLELRPR